MDQHLFKIRGAARGEILFDEEDLPLLLPYSWSIGSHGYAQGCGSGVKIMLMHRYLIGHVPTGMLVDHINRNKLDNRRSNLRIVTPHESSMNRSVIGTGVHQRKSGRFSVKVQRRCVEHNLGTYDTYEEALGVAEAWKANYDYGK